MTENEIVVLTDAGALSVDNPMTDLQALLDAATDSPWIHPELSAMSTDLAKRVLELEAALESCLNELMSVYHSKFDGVWASEDFDKIEVEYSQALKGGEA